MFVVMAQSASEAEVLGVKSVILGEGLTPYDHTGAERTVIAVIGEIGGRRPDLHVVITGRNAKPELIAAADLVTDMSLVKHHFAAGVKAQPGIEF